MRCLLGLLTMTLGLAAPLSAADQPLDQQFLRDYAETRGFLLGRPVNIKIAPTADKIYFLRSEARKPKRLLYVYDVATTKTTEVVSPDVILKGNEEKLTPEEKARRERMRLSAGGFADYFFDSDFKQILLPLSGKLYLYTLATKEIKELKTGPGTIIDPKWSPNNQKISYVLNHDVFVYDLATDKETAITTGGTEDKPNGLAEFVAQEEMSRFTGYWWAHDSKSIAFQHSDHTGVDVWYVADPNKPGQAPLKQYYPRPGKKNVAVKLGIKAIDKPQDTTWVEWDTKSFEYLAAVKWDKTGHLTIQIQDRKQQEIQLHLVDATTGKTKQLLSEQDKAFTNINQNMPHWLDQNRFLWTWENRGTMTVDLHSRSGQLLDTILAPKAEMTKFLGYHLSKNNIWYSTAKTTAESHITYWYYNPKALERLPGSDQTNKFTDFNGQESVVFSKDFDLAVVSQSNFEKMPIASIYRDGKKIGELPSVAEEPKFTPSVTFGQFGVNQPHQYAIIKPRHFDEKKKYPIIVDVYGGPHHLHVVNAKRNWLMPQFLADQGYVVIAIENRGTPGRGRDWEREIYQKFGEVPLDDQVKILQQLCAKHSYLDAEKVGITGWSFGGYMSALAVHKRPDIFKAAVAGAPVTDWEDYDSHYTERYLGLPDESPRAYVDASLIPLAKDLKRPLLLVHGTADDNVYFKHTLRLTDALFRHGKEFDVLPLPSLTHMLPDPVVTEKLWTKVVKYFDKHLK